MTKFLKRFFKREKAIEDAIRERLTGEAQKNALDFISFMRANGFEFEYYNLGHAEGWTTSYGGNILIPRAGSGKGQMSIHAGLLAGFGNAGAADDGLKEAVWEHVRVCPQSSCKPPYCKENAEHPGCQNRVTIFGKEFESTCHAVLGFTDPDAETYENIKKLFLMMEP